LPVSDKATVTEFQYEEKGVWFGPRLLFNFYVYTKLKRNKNKNNPNSDDGNDNVHNSTNRTAKDLLHLVLH
jgi:hypothetical protein